MLYNELTKLQCEMECWEKKNFPNETSNDMLLGIMEEVGELSRAVRKRSEGIRSSEDHDAKEIDAIGDIFISLTQYCSLRGLNLAQCVLITWEEVRKRDWIRYPENGVDK